MSIDLKKLTVKGNKILKKFVDFYPNKKKALQVFEDMVDEGKLTKVVKKPTKRKQTT